MTIVDPLPPEAPYGVADWKDYKHNWREVDTDWIQDRTILRFATAAQRDAKILTPQVGQFIYNNTTDLLEYRSKTGTWKAYKASPVNLDAITDTTTAVKLGHSAAGGKGLTFSATGMSTDTSFAINGGTLTVADTGVTIKTGTKAVLLTTTTTDLVSDSPITAPSLTLTGSGTVLTATGKTLAVGTLTATSVSAATIAASGALTGGVGSSINGVDFPGNYTSAASGYVVSWGYFYGNTNGSIMRKRDPGTGTLGASYIHVLDTSIQSVATYHDFYSTPRVMNERAIQFYNDDNTAVLGYGGPVVYTSAAISAADYPNGTIWVSP